MSLEAYLKLEKENQRLREEIENWKLKYNEYRNGWNKVAQGLNTLFNWLETRKDTKTETIRRKMAETFKWAYMEAQFEDLRAKWPNAEARVIAAKWYPSSVHKEQKTPEGKQ